MVDRKSPSAGKRPQGIEKQPASRDASAEPPPLSRLFDVDGQVDFPARVEIVANAAEREALAKMLRIPAVERLEARLRVARIGNRYDVCGVASARVTQICVVSLEPFDSDVVEDVEASFAETPKRASRPPRRGVAQPALEIVVDQGDDPPDPIVDGRIDLGVLVSEFLALGLDPYPRKPGVELDVSQAGDPPPASPFAVLGRLKKGHFDK